MFLKSSTLALILFFLSKVGLGAHPEQIPFSNNVSKIKTFEFDLLNSRKTSHLLVAADVKLAQGIENPFEIPSSDFPSGKVLERPMVIPKKKPSPEAVSPSSIINPSSAVTPPPSVTLEIEEKVIRPLAFEFSISLSYAKLRNWNSRQAWSPDPISGFNMGFRWMEDSKAMTGLRVMSITGAGTTQDTTGVFGYTYIGPYIAHVEISEAVQSSFSTGFSLAKISGKTQVGPGEEEFEPAPGLRTDPPGLWAEVKYGKMTGGAWSNGVTAGIQWGRKRLFYWLGLYSSAWQ